MGLSTGQNEPGLDGGYGSRAVSALQPYPTRWKREIQAPPLLPLPAQSPDFSTCLPHDSRSRRLQ